MRNDKMYDLAALVAILGTVGALVVTGQGAEMLGAAALATTSLFGAWRQRRQRPDRASDGGPVAEATGDRPPSPSAT